MDSLIFLIAQFLMPHAMGLDVVPFQGDIRVYEFNHRIGIFLIRLDGGRLVVNLPFRSLGNHVAAVYMDALAQALAQGITLPDDEGRLVFTLEKNAQSFRAADKIDIHVATYGMELVAPPAEAPVPAENTPSPAEDA
jgi:hypothetical protein